MSGINLGTTSFFGGSTFGNDGRPRDPRDTSFYPPQGNGNGGSGAETVTGGNGNSTITGGGNGNDKLGDDFTALSDTLWNPKPANGSGNETQNGSGGNQQQQQQQDKPKQLTYDEFLNSKDFYKIQQFTPEESAKMQQGDMSPIAQRISDGLKNVYKEAVLDSGKLTDGKVASAVEQAVSKADMGRHSEEFINYMKSELDFTREPGILPVAITVLGKFVNQGMSKEKAIENVRKYFEGSAERVLNSKNKRNGGSGNGSFNSNSLQNSYGSDAAEDFDWGKFYARS